MWAQVILLRSCWLSYKVGINIRSKVLGPKPLLINIKKLETLYYTLLLASLALAVSAPDICLYCELIPLHRGRSPVGWGGGMQSWMTGFPHRPRLGQCKVFQEVQHHDLALLTPERALSVLWVRRGAVCVVGKFMNQLARTPLQLETLKARRWNSWKCNWAFPFLLGGTDAKLIWENKKYMSVG